MVPANSVTFDGSCSVDPDNNITSYVWTMIAGSTANIGNPNAVQTQVTGFVQGVYQFELKVIDAKGLFSKDTMQVTVRGAVAYNCGDTNRPHINARLTQVGALSFAASDITVASAGNKILFGGVDIFDLTTQAWSTAGRAGSSDGHFSPTVVAAGNKIFFAGGYTGDGTFSSKTADVYDVSSNKWSVFSLSQPGGEIAAATVGTKVFFAGGDKAFNYGIRETTVDIYDLSTNSWSAQMLNEAKVFGHSATSVNNRIYFAGGYTDNYNNGFVTRRIDIYDNVTDSGQALH